MKKALLVMSIALLSSQSFASSKICFGSKTDDTVSGVVEKVEISLDTVSMKAIKGNFYTGTYPAYNTTVKGRDGKVYMEYKGENVDYQDVIMVDKELLKAGTTGLLQVRARGEGFFNSVFFCRDGK